MTKDIVDALSLDLPARSVLSGRVPAPPVAGQPLRTSEVSLKVVAPGVVALRRQEERAAARAEARAAAKRARAEARRRERERRLTTFRSD